MHKRSLHHIWTRLRPYKTWYFLVAAALCAVVGLIALRDNYTTMTRLRAAVYTADQNNGDVVAALNRLRSFVHTHMNTDLAREHGIYPPIHLAGTYSRLQAAEQERVTVTNSRVYTEAQHHCEQLYPGSFSGGPRVPCIEQYVKDHGTSARPTPQALYTFNFVTPRWSPDLAGWSLALAGLLGILGVLRFIAGRILESLTR